MYQLEKNLIDELNDNKKEILENEDLLHEYVDSHIPVYNYDRLLLACDDLWLGYPSERFNDCKVMEAENPKEVA